MQVFSSHEGQVVLKKTPDLAWESHWKDQGLIILSVSLSYGISTLPDGLLCPPNSTDLAYSKFLFPCNYGLHMTAHDLDSPSWCLVLASTGNCLI